MNEQNERTVEMRPGKFMNYTIVSSYPTLSETIAKNIPAAAGLSDSRCMALIEEAKQAAPPYITTTGERAAWIRYYITAKLANE